MQHLENATDLIVFSEHEFGSKVVRTTELMIRFGPRRRIYFFSQPIMESEETTPHYIKSSNKGVIVIQPYLPKNISIFAQHDFLVHLLKFLMKEENIHRYTIWADTPKAITYVRYLTPEIIVYDCVEDYTQTAYSEMEDELGEYADVVLTSGKTQHFKPTNVLPFALKAYKGNVQNG